MPKTWKRLVELVIAKGGYHYAGKTGPRLEILNYKNRSLKRWGDGSIHRNEDGIRLDLLVNMRVKDAYEYFGIKEK